MDGYNSIFVRYKSSTPFLIGTTKSVVRSLDIKDLMEMSDANEMYTSRRFKITEDISTLRYEMRLKFEGRTDDASIAEKQTLLDHLNGNIQKTQFKLANAIEEDKLTSFVSGSVLDS